jgi:hypothetical protein
MRGIQELPHRPQPGIGDTSPFELSYDLFGREMPEGLFDLAFQHLPVGEPVRVTQETCIFRQIGTLQHRLAELLPFPLVLDAEEVDLASAHAKGL